MEAGVHMVSRAGPWVPGPNLKTDTRTSKEAASRSMLGASFHFLNGDWIRQCLASRPGGVGGLPGLHCG